MRHGNIFLQIYIQINTQTHTHSNIDKVYKDERVHFDEDMNAYCKLSILSSDGFAAKKQSKKAEH